jgi:hypothetical protein
MRAPAATAVVMALLGLCWSGAAAVRSAMVVIPLKAKERMDRFLRRARWHSESDDLAEHLRSLKLACIGSGALVVAVPVVSSVTHLPFARLLQEVAMMGVSVVLVACGCGAAQRGALHRAAKGRPPSPTGRRYHAIGKQQHHPFVIYRRPSKEEEARSDDFRDALLFEDSVKPFVGAGRLIHRWNPPLTIHLLKEDGDSIKNREIDPLPRAHDLVAYLKDEMRRLDGEDDATSLPGFRMKDRIYVAEADVDPERRWLLDEPEENEVNEIINRPFDRFHHFLEICASESGELVTTVFLRTTVKGRALSLDFAACALTRTPDEYHLLDYYGEDGFGAVLRAALRSLAELPADTVRSWRLIHLPVLVLGAIRARRDRLPFPKRGVKIGPELSLREEKSVSWESAQLDRTLISDHVKLIEDRLLKAATEFLRGKGVDVSEFEERVTSIINTGIMNFGETMNVNGSAVGPNAHVKLDLPESFGSATGRGHA